MTDTAAAVAPPANEHDGDDNDNEFEISDSACMQLLMRNTLAERSILVMHEHNLFLRNFESDVSIFRPAALPGECFLAALPKPHRVLIIRGDAGVNEAIFHDTEEVFTLNPALGVAPLPDGVAFMCNCTMVDAAQQQQTSEKKLRVLVYDMHNTHRSNAEMDAPTSRYCAMRADYECFFADARSDIFELQWAGYPAGFMQYLPPESPSKQNRPRVQLDYEIAGAVLYTNDPLHPTHLVRTGAPTVKIVDSGSNAWGMCVPVE